MKIVNLEVENIKKIKAVEIEPDGNIVIISGKNGQGKSALLDSMGYALCGKEAIPGQPVRKGAKSGSVTLDIDGEMKVRIKRTFTSDGTTKLYVTDASENPVGSPQTFIERFLGKMTLDPAKFLALDPREQRRVLLDLLQIDFSEIDRKINTLKESRSILNRDKKSLEVNLGYMNHTDDLPDEEISVAGLTTELRRRQEHNTNLARSREFIADCEAEIESKEELRVDLQKRIDDLNLRVMQTMTEICKIKEEKANETAKIEGKLDENPDEILAQIAESEDTNRKIRVNQKITEIEGKIQKIRDEYHEQGQKIEELEASKQKLLTDAKMPIPDLTAGEEGLQYNGIPLEQASESEQLRVALSIAMALNPKLRVIRSSANAFDSNALRIIGEMAQAKDYQVWLEKVDESGQVGFVIEDGRLVKD